MTIIEFFDQLRFSRSVVIDTMNWLGDTAHRRVVVAIVVAVTAKIAGHEINSEFVDDAIYLLTAVALGALAPKPIVAPDVPTVDGTAS